MQKMLETIKASLNKGNLSHLKLTCYVCEGPDHISIDCSLFALNYEGNIKRYFEKTLTGKKLRDKQLKEQESLVKSGQGGSKIGEEGPERHLNEE